MSLYYCILTHNQKQCFVFQSQVITGFKERYKRYGQEFGQSTKHSICCVMIHAIDGCRFLQSNSESCVLCSQHRLGLVLRKGTRFRDRILVTVE